MLDKKTLVERLESYDFSERKMGRGFGQTIDWLQTRVQMIAECGILDQTDLADMELVHTVLGRYYSLIDFKELEDSRGEPAVDQLFRTREALVGLSFAYWAFRDSCTKYLKDGLTPDNKMPGYQEMIGATSRIVELDRDGGIPGSYRRRVKALKGG